MPTYVLKCPGCLKVEERRNIRVEDCDRQVCKCGNYMQVQIVTANFTIRHGRPDVIKWRKQKDVLNI
jgi:hypothetical protein